MALKPTQRSLKRWTEQKWQYSSEKEADKPRKKRGRYLPEAAWQALSPAEKAATNRAKRKGSKAGKQFVKQPKKVAAKTRSYRKGVGG
jgi:hypothetical protein